MKKEAPGMLGLIILGGLLAVSTAACGAPSQMGNQELLEMLMQARDDGKSDLVALMSIFLTLFTITVTLTGFVVYRKVKSSLEEHLRGKILENEARSLIRLSFAYYQTFCDTRHHAPQSSNVSISHAAQQAQLAAQNLEKITGGVDETVVRNLKALALTNAAYYLTERKRLVDDNNLGESEEIARLAVKLAQESTFYVEVAERQRAMEGLKWWNVVESRLSALSRCDPKFDQAVAIKNSNSSWRIQPYPVTGKKK